MAGRYMAILAADAEVRRILKHEVAAQSPLPLVFESSALLVFADPADQVVPIGDWGCLIGHLFSTSEQPIAVTRLNDTEGSQIITSRGDALRDSYWGGYAAFWIDADCVTVARDPSGAMPVYEFQTRGAVVFTSDMETATSAGLLKTSIDWSFLPQHLFNAGLRSDRTALSGVTELLPGFKVTFSPSGDRCEDVFWSPWDYIQTSAVTGAELETHLGDTVRACVSAWASRYKQIVTGVSGGLDSSIIAATLAAGTDHSACLTFATDEPEGDERPYARLLTDALNLPLYEHFHDPNRVDLRQSTSAYLPRPMGNFIGQSADIARHTLTQTLPFDAYFSGRGGDNVFCYMMSPTPLLDRIKAEGLSTGAWQTLYDICRLADCSVWDVAKLGLTRAASVRRRYDWRGQSGFLHRDVRPVQVSNHPWLAGPKHAPFGKIVHVVMLMRIQGTLEGFSRYAPAELVTPLLSQPIMELCLSIPSWVWCAGGENRAPVRRAFAKALPPKILQRRTKGGPDSFCIEVIERNRNLLKAILLDGILMSQGLIDRVAIERCLSDPAPIVPPNHLHLAVLAETEAWVSAWQEKGLPFL